MSTMLPALLPTSHSLAATDLCGEFQRLSRWTWDHLATAASLGMPLKEETITDLLLMELAKNCPLRVKVIPFSKAREAQVGADWEWWFWDWPYGIGCRVQAKKLNHSTWCFDSLKFKPTGRAQIDTLRQAATADLLEPLYCFYGFEGGRYRSPNLFTDHLQGCSIAHADRIADVGHKAGFRVISVSAPWHTLVCPCSGGADGLLGIAAAINVLRGEGDVPSREIVRQLPDYVSNVVLEKKRHPSLEPISRDKADRLRPVRGIVAINVSRR